MPEGCVTLNGLLRAVILIGISLVTFTGIRFGNEAGIFDFFFVAGAVIGFLLIAISPERHWIISRHTIVGIWTFLLLGILSSIVSISPVESIVGLSKLVVACVGIPILVGAVCSSREVNRLGRTLWVIFASVNGFVGFINLTMGTRIGESLVGQSNWIGRAEGLTTHPNHLGLATVMALPVAIVLLFEWKSVKQRIMGVVVASGLLAGIVASGSRAVLGGAVLSIIILGIFEKRLRKSILYLSVLGLLVMLAVSFDNSIYKIMTFGWRRLMGGVASVEVSDQVRLAYYSAGISHFFEGPFIGVGFENVRKYHNIYLQLLQAGGVVGFLIFFAYISNYLVIGWRIKRMHTLPRIERMISGSLTASILIWLFIGLTHNEIYDRYIYIPFGLLLGLKQITNRLAVTQRQGPRDGYHQKSEN